MQVMLGMLPMLVKEMKGGKGERISTAKGGKDLREEREKIWGKNALRGKGGKRSLGGKGKSFSGGTPYGAMGGQDLKRERGKKTLGREGWRSWGEKALGGKREKGS